VFEAGQATGEKEYEAGKGNSQVSKYDRPFGNLILIHSHIFLLKKLFGTFF